MITIRCALSQKSVDFIYFAAKAWNNADVFLCSFFLPVDLLSVPPSLTDNNDKRRTNWKIQLSTVLNSDRNFKLYCVCNDNGNTKLYTRTLNRRVVTVSSICNWVTNTSVFGINCTLMNNIFGAKGHPRRAISPTLARNVMNVAVVCRHGKLCWNGWIWIVSLCDASTAGKCSSFGVKVNIKI